MNTSKHRHRAVPSRSDDRCYAGCVDPDRCQPAAHGCVTIIDVCRCGARRHTNANGRHVEYGPWVDAD